MSPRQRCTQYIHPKLTCDSMYPSYAIKQWSSTFFGLPPTSNLVGRHRPPMFASLFLTRGFGLICIPHVIRLDAKQNAKGCATCTWREGATTKLFLGGPPPLIKILYPPLTSYQQQQKIQPGQLGTSPRPPPPPLDATAYGSGS